MKRGQTDPAWTAFRAKAVRFDDLKVGSKFRDPKGRDFIKVGPGRAYGQIMTVNARPLTGGMGSQFGPAVLVEPIN